MNLSKKEKKLILESIQYLLGAELLEENGWSKEDFNILKELENKLV